MAIRSLTLRLHEGHIDDRNDHAHTGGCYIEVRTPIGRYGGAFKDIRADDLGAVPLRSLMARHPHMDWEAVQEVLFGCANQAGEDNRNWRACQRV